MQEKNKMGSKITKLTDLNNLEVPNLLHSEAEISAYTLKSNFRKPSMKLPIRFLKWNLMLHLITIKYILIPPAMTANEIKTPITPKSTIATKLRKNCFFFTWNLQMTATSSI